MIAQLISAGTPQTTSVRVDDKAIQGVTKVQFVQEVDDCASLTVELFVQSVEVEGHLTAYMWHPVEGGLRQISSIHFQDGSEWSAL